MPEVSHAAGRASEQPTFAQFKELFAQAESGRLTKSLLQETLRGTSDDRGWFRFTNYPQRNLLELRQENPDIFPNFPVVLEHQPFAVVSSISPWENLALRTSAVPGTMNKSFEQQVKLLKPREFVPTVRELVVGLISSYRRDGIRMFPNCWLLTSDLTYPLEKHVRVKFDDGGILIWSGPVADHDDLCIAVAQRC